MIITLYKSEIVDDLLKKSRLEAAAIEDRNTRYRIEAGTEKADEIVREIASVSASLTKMLRRYLVSYDEILEGDDTLGAKTQYQYILDFSDRRTEGKAEALATVMHDYVVHYVLARYYASVSAQDLSNVHSAMTQATAQELRELIYEKKEPTV